MLIKIISKTEKLIILNSSKEHYINNEEINIESENSFNLVVYPLTKNSNKASLSYCARICFENNTLNTSCEHVNIINYPDISEVFLNDFEIDLMNNSVLLNKLNFEYNQKKYEVLVYNNVLNNFVIKQNDFEFSHTLYGIKHCAIHHLNNFVILNYVCDKSHILVFNLTQNKIEFDEPAEQFEIDRPNNKMSVLKPLYDCLGHATVYLISLNETFIILDQYPTYLNEDQLLIEQPSEFIFFDCIKAKNFKKARSLLTQELNLCVSNEHLESFFNKFKEIKQISTSNNFFLIPDKKICNASILNLEKQDNLINNIKILYK